MGTPIKALQAFTLFVIGLMLTCAIGAALKGNVDLVAFYCLMGFLNTGLLFVRREQ